MQCRIQVRFILTLMLAVSTAVVSSGTTAAAQMPAEANRQAHSEVELQYNYVRSNAPPGSCDCINLNGGSVTFAMPLLRLHWEAVGDVSVTHADSIAGPYTSDRYSLTLSSYTAGLRYRPFRRGRLQPYVQALVGVAHGGGSLFQSGASSVAFAGIFGGGLDYRISRHFGLRLAEADYLLTTFDNGVNGHQNNVRIGAGLIFRF